MAIQLGALRDALEDAGAAPDKAAKAAEELAGYEHEFTAIRLDMQRGFNDLRMAANDLRIEFGGLRSGTASEFGKVWQEFAKVRGDLNLLRWMVGANSALTLAVFVKLFIH
jgi:hypothetical protein